MRQTGVVLRTEADRALVSMGGTESCGACGNREFCKALSPRTEGKAESWVENKAGAAKGDIVEVELKPSSALLAIATTFLLPVALMLLGYFAGPAGTPLRRAAGAGAGLIVGIAVSVFVNRSIAGRPGFSTEIVKVVRDASCTEVTEGDGKSR